MMEWKEQLELEATYMDVMCGKAEPHEAWMTGEAALTLMQRMGEPLVDARGAHIDPKRGYYLSRETGLVPY